MKNSGKYGLIGDPIKKSLSPALFSAAYNQKFNYDLIEGKDFEASWAKFIKDYDAINITAPFKEDAFQKCDLYSGPTAVIGATNLVVKTKEGLMAHNSDFSGVILSVAEALFPGITSDFYKMYKLEAHKMIHIFVKKMLIFKYKTVRPNALVVGCGGAGKAAAVAAAELGFNVAIMNRSLDKVEKFTQRLSKYHFIPVPITDFKASFKECELIIYALPVKIDAIDDLTEDDFRLEYNPLEKSFDTFFAEKLKKEDINESTMDLYKQIAAEKTRKIVLEANYKKPSFTTNRDNFEASVKKLKESIDEGDNSFDAIQKMNKVLNSNIEAFMQAADCLYVPGTNWLLNQAIVGYGIMTGKAPSLVKMNNVFI